VTENSIEPLPKDEVHFPLDLTAVSNTVIGQQHSYWSARHAYSLYAVAVVASELAHARHDLRLEEANYWALRGKEFKNKWELEHGMTMEHLPARKLQTKILRLSTKLEIMKSLSESYEGLRNAASREMSRRLGERAQAD
jgi:hypothetical protein